MAQNYQISKYLFIAILSAKNVSCELGLIPALLYLKERLIAESADVLPLFVVNLSYVTGSSVKLRESSITLVTRETPNFRRRRGTYDESGHLKAYSKWPYINDVKVSISSTFYMSLFLYKIAFCSFSLLKFWLFNFLANEYRRKSYS